MSEVYGFFLTKNVCLFSLFSFFFKYDVKERKRVKKSNSNIGIKYISSTAAGRWNVKIYCENPFIKLLGAKKKTLSRTYLTYFFITK